MQFMGFFATYVILWLYKRYARGSSLLIPRVSFEYVWQRVGATVFIVLLTASIFISRYISLQDTLLAIDSCWGSTTSTSWLLAALLDALPVLSGSLWIQRYALYSHFIGRFFPNTTRISWICPCSRCFISKYASAHSCWSVGLFQHSKRPSIWIRECQSLHKGKRRISSAFDLFQSNIVCPRFFLVILFM